MQKSHLNSYIFLKLIQYRILLAMHTITVFKCPKILDSSRFLLTKEGNGDDRQKRHSPLCLPFFQARVFCIYVHALDMYETSLCQGIPEITSFGHLKPPHIYF